MAQIAHGYMVLVMSTKLRLVGVSGEARKVRVPVARYVAAKGSRRLRWHIWTGTSALAGEAGQDSRCGFDRRIRRVHVIHFHGSIVSISTWIELLLADFGIAAPAGEIVGQSIIIPTLERDASRIEAFVVNCHHAFVSFLADNDTSIPPGEVVLVPEGVERQDKTVNWIGADVNNHPSNMLPLPLDYKDDRLQAIYTSQDDDGEQRELALVGRHRVDQIAQVHACRRENDGSQEINQDDKSHTEAAETT